MGFLATGNLNYSGARVMSGRDVSYIQSRLESLHAVDVKLVSMLDNLSTTLELLKDHKREGIAKSDEFKTAVSGFYGDLSSAAVGLNREIKAINNKVNSQSEELDLLPIQINKKAVWVNQDKLNEEVDRLDKIAGFKDIQVPDIPEVPVEQEQTAPDVEMTTQEPLNEDNEKKMVETIDLDDIEMSEHKE
ncbi:hypothetical protein OGAPHI_004037 [Ogataea philodendri]|uniref:Mediator of RNA polymerase II transcription subunit 11 n=1 Tax=Ogataea philodendri TaxID=1378263 RepID=A0A9P8P727_9ASCO|nr:uncharacterized protein OGAPHI_004037 [Ogataea philodendri]KAH3665849.1 hypothetical protein OGAPHI_004037 [Ogataea philodendri]